jgi:hypothetical protein
MTSLSNQSTAHSSTVASSQFKHTLLWNNIIQNLKDNLIEDRSGSVSSSTSSSTTITNSTISSKSNSISSNENSMPYSNRLRKQHSRFVTSGMLLIKQNLLSSNGCSPHSNCLDNICFTGSHCVDIVFNYLTSKEQIGNFERQITREKVTKVK